MNRKTLILFGAAGVLLVVVVVLAVSLRGGREGTTPPAGNYDSYGTPTSGVVNNPETIGVITVYPPVAGWRLAENNSLNVSLKIPEDWDISGEVSKYDFKAAWNSERASMAADIYSYDNKNKITPSQWAKNGGLQQFLAITVGGVSGVRYVTKIAYEAIFDEGVSEIEDSYIVGFILPQGDKMIDVSCFVTGVDFELYKSKCDEVINTFSFTE